MIAGRDNFLAGPEFNASLEKGVPFYDAMAMKRIGYDAITIGNHEFDFGPEILSGFIRGFPTRMPFVSANLEATYQQALCNYIADGLGGQVTAAQYPEAGTGRITAAGH